MIRPTMSGSGGTGKPPVMSVGYRGLPVALVVARGAMMSVMSELSGVSDMSGYRWDVADVAPVVGVSEPTVRRMAAKGRLPYYRPGHKYLFRPVDVDEFVKKSRADCADAAGGVAGAEDLAKTA